MSALLVTTSRLTALISLSLTLSLSAAELVRDINAVPLAVGSSANTFVELGGRSLFLRDDGVHGTELWRSDGTPEGTRLVLDIKPGPDGSNPESLTVVSGAVYFVANDGTNGRELWRSDGTTAGTAIVADINRGTADGINNAVADGRIPLIGNILYFAGVTQEDAELWRSDGTAAGTYRVADISNAPGGGNPLYLTRVGNRLFFTAYNAATGAELWSSDGTAAGTRLVSDINPAANAAGPTILTASTAGIWMLADDGRHGRELWFADASGTNAHLVADLSPGPNDVNIDAAAPLSADLMFAATSVEGTQAFRKLYRAGSSSKPTALLALPLGQAMGFIPIGGRLLFPGSASNAGGSGNPEVWVSDGTSKGTRRLGAGMGLEATSLIATGRGVFGSLLVADGYYFFGYSGGRLDQIDLWRTDGTDAGTLRYASLPQPFVSSDLAQYNGQIYLSAGPFGATGTEPWVSNGTPAGTRLFKDLNPGAADSVPTNFIASNGKLYFNAVEDDAAGPAVFVSDGTSDGTRSLGQANPNSRTAGSSPSFLTAIGSKLLFAANDGVSGREPWISDGTSGGTGRLANITADNNAFGPPPFAACGAFALFSQDDGVHGAEPWITDGTPAGTRLLADIRPGSNGSDALGFSTSAALMNGICYFSANDGQNGPALWRTDGTSAGTFLVATLPGAGVLVDFHVLDGALLFQANEAGGRFWWRSNGTAVGTTRITKAANITSTVSVPFNGQLYFIATHQLDDEITFRRDQIWRTDGTAGGTQAVTNLLSDASYVGSDFLYPAGDSYLLFKLCSITPPTGCHLGSLDIAGTTRQLSIETPSGPPAQLGNRAFYTALVGNRFVLKVSDGTEQGTREVFRFPTTNSGGAIAAVAGRIIFSVVDPILGPSIWKTDGTTAGTALVAVGGDEIDPSTAMGQFTEVGSNIYFSARSQLIGDELYVLRRTEAVAGDDSALTDIGAPVVIPVTNNDGSLLGTVIPGSVLLSDLPDSGNAIVNGDGTIRYTPNPGFSGLDRFQYTIHDDLGHPSKPAIVQVLVAQPSGPAPGMSPSGEVPSPGGIGGESGGGGGALDLASLGALLLILLAKHRYSLRAKAQN